MNLILLGPPGAGKGTQASLLVARLAIPHISTGEILREAGRRGTQLGLLAKPLIEAGHLVPDEVAIRVMSERLLGQDVKSGFILDGFPRTVGQAEALEPLLREAGLAAIGRVFFLDVSDEKIAARVSGRRSCPRDGQVFHVTANPPRVEGRCDQCGGALETREDDEPEMVLERMKLYRRSTEPLIAYYKERGLLVSLDAMAPAEEVHAEIVAALPFPRSREEAARECEPGI